MTDETAPRPGRGDAGQPPAAEPRRRRAAHIDRRLFTWSCLAFLIFYVAFRPVSAAAVLDQVGDSVIDLGRRFAEFFRALTAPEGM